MGPFSLSQNGLQVLVSDQSGRPVSGALVTSAGSSQETGHDGVALVPASREVRVTYEGMSVSKDVLRSGDTVFVTFPVCVSGPLLKPVDIALLAGAGLLTAAGVYWKSDPLKVAGEVIFGASAFTVIYRLSCL